MHCDPTDSSMHGRRPQRSAAMPQIHDPSRLPANLAPAMSPTADPVSSSETPRSATMNGRNGNGAVETAEFANMSTNTVAIWGIGSGVCGRRDVEAPFLPSSLLPASSLLAASAPVSKSCTSASSFSAARPSLDQGLVMVLPRTTAPLCGSQRFGGCRVPRSVQRPRLSAQGINPPASVQFKAVRLSVGLF
eukprot:m.11642 g.11642  ORF g.11642 m.11642 type:complete len:191 (-) comp4465_c0_seq1:58-630(-)